MREKVTASFLFRNRKESYERSVAHPFQGDYVRLRQNTQWRKIVNESVDHFIVFADIVSKITRSSGRVTTPTTLTLPYSPLSLSPPPLLHTHIHTSPQTILPVIISFTIHLFINRFTVIISDQMISTD